MRSPHRSSRPPATRLIEKLLSYLTPRERRRGQAPVRPVRPVGDMEDGLLRQARGSLGAGQPPSIVTLSGHPSGWCGRRLYGVWLRLMLGKNTPPGGGS